MPAKKNPQYLDLIKQGLYGKPEPYKRSDGKELKGVTYSFAMQKDQDDEKLLAKFATSEREVARLHSDNISINLVGLPTNVLNALISTFEGYVDEAGENLILPIAENENAIRFHTQENMFEMEIANEAGITYKCIIDPLGVIISTKEADAPEKQVVNTRPNIDEIVLLSETDEGRATVQKQIVNCGLTPEFLEAALNPDDKRVRTPQKITELSPALVEMYLQHKISTGEIKQQDGAYTFKPSEQSKYSFMAIAAPLEKGESEPKLIYFAQKGGNADRSGTSYICRDRFYEIKDLRFTTTGAKKSTTKAHVTFTTQKSKNKTTSTSIAVPLKEGHQPTEQVIKNVLDFVGKTAKITAASTESLSDWSHESASIRDFKGGVPPLAFVARSDLAAAENLAEQPNPQSERSDEHSADPNEQPRQPDAQPDSRRPVPPQRSAPAREQHLANGGPRVNPYLEQPRKVIKKVPKKLNEDLIRYGGFAIGLLMLPLLLLGPVIGPILFTAGLVVAAGSIGLANYIHAFNDNPYNGLVTKYQNQLSREQNEAEEQAGKFWEIETELGTERDNLANLRDLIFSPEFVSYDPALASNINGALFEHLFHTTSEGGQKAFEKFWDQSLEYRTRFLEDLREVMAEDTDALGKQKRFLRKYEIDDVLLPAIFEKDYEVSVPDPNDPSKSIIKTISAREALEAGIAVLERYNDSETKIRALHDQVGQAIQDCSGKTLERIISQPGVDLDKFVTEHAHDLAARFLYRKDIPQSQIDNFLSKLSPESADKILAAKDEVQVARVETKTIARRQKENDAQYERALDTLDRLDIIREDKDFDESSLKTVAQIGSDVENILWALSGEDAKRNALARADTKEVTTNGLQELCLSGLSSPLGPTTATDLVHFDGYEKYTELLHERHELLADPRIVDALTNQVMLVGSQSTLTSSASLLSLDEDSLKATLNLLKEDSSIKKDPELLKRVENASQLEEARRDAKQTITEGTAKQLQKRMKWDRYAKAPAQEDLDAEIEHLKEQYPNFTTLSEDGQRSIATMILGRDEVLQAIIKDKHLSETDSQKKSLIKAAEKDFDGVIDGLVSGTFAEKFVADKELQSWEAEKPESVPTREEASDRLLEMDYTLTVYGIEGADRKAVIEKMSQIAENSGRSEATKEDLLNAIFEQTKSSQLNDCSERAVERKTTLGKIAKGKNMAKKEDVQALREELQTMRQQSETRAKEKTNPLKQVAGKRQIEHDYDIARKGKKEKESKVKVRRSEKRYNKTRDQAEEFLGKANNALDKLGKVSTCVTGKVGSKTKEEMKSRVDDLQTSLSKETEGLLSNGEMKDLFADLKGVGSWDDIKRKIDSGKFTEADFKLIKAQLEKLLREKNRKLSKRLKRRRVKATKQNAEGKNKAADSKTIEQNSEKLKRANDAVTARRDMAKERTAAPERVAPELAKEVAQNQVSYKFEKE